MEYLEYLSLVFDIDPKQEGESSTYSSQQSPDIVNPNTRIVPCFFNGNNNKD